jgi:hypothetical protein
MLVVRAQASALMGRFVCWFCPHSDLKDFQLCWIFLVFGPGQSLKLLGLRPVVDWLLKLLEKILKKSGLLV